ncbi:MAG: nuclear transport factor 2 family protein [Candidatus Heimdallarchaeota archaeon]|nr:nuclear transport factor 2 family protein [Candidatus Heimdallarchaeota archaeon]
MNQESEILDILKRMLYGIRDGGEEVYKELVSESLTCFEPETQGHNVDGLDFHLFFMRTSKQQHPYHLELVDPRIRVYGDTAYTAYTLLQNTYTPDGYKIKKVNETRIFHKEDGKWKMVHFHRS